MNKEIPYKIYLEESELPKAWLNLRAFMKDKPEPLLSPKTLRPMTKEELSEIFCEELATQELDDKSKQIEIPQEMQAFFLLFLFFVVPKLLIFPLLTQHNLFDWPGN